jgi:hypothetical protein
MTMNGATRAVLAAAGAFVCCGYALAGSADAPIPFPEDFRTWAHVKSVLVGPESSWFPTEGGIHHIYANSRAMEGYPTGTFPDGSILVYNLLETKVDSGMTVESATRRVDVMVKDGTRYAKNGGWGYARFMGANRTENQVTADMAATCSACHAKRKDHDYVFSEFRQ